VSTATAAARAAARAPDAAAEAAKPPAAAVIITGLTKVYGEAQALAGVDLVVPEGSVFGFLGPNGAGKTTTLRILAGLARPTAGSATIFGLDTTRDADAVHAMIGYLPDVPGFYKWMTATEYLELSAKLFGLPAAVRRERIETLLELAGLDGVDTKVGGYSRGMKQRLGVAQALINSPRLLLLDEPTSALDPIGRREVLEMIAALAGRTTVFFSTHILADVERVCDTVAVLAGGRVVEQAGIDELKARHGGAHRVVIEVDDTRRLQDALATEAWAAAVTRDGRELLVEVVDHAEAGAAAHGHRERCRRPRRRRCERAGQQPGGHGGAGKDAHALPGVVEPGPAGLSAGRLEVQESARHRGRHRGDHRGRDAPGRCSVHPPGRAAGVVATFPGYPAVTGVRSTGSRSTRAGTIVSPSPMP